MSFIEGIGDEVTILFGFLFLFILGYVLWLSTSVSDTPLIRVILLDRTVFQQFLQRINSLRRNQPATETRPTENQPNSGQVPPPIIDRNKSPTTTEIRASVESQENSQDSGNNNSAPGTGNETNSSQDAEVIHPTVLESFLRSTETSSPGTESSTEHESTPWLQSNVADSPSNFENNASTGER